MFLIEIIQIHEYLKIYINILLILPLLCNIFLLFFNNGTLTLSVTDLRSIVVLGDFIDE